jgi:ferredoxin-type protein NapF
MESVVTRRAWLTGRFGHNRQTIRPPWAIAEAQFVERCSRCNQCITHCEQGIIHKGDGGFPEINFSYGECTFCEACVDSCEDLALQKTTNPWQLKANINDTCLAAQSIICISCAENCEVEAIQFKSGKKAAMQPHVDLEKCTGCGACFSPCPTQSITLCQTSI